MTANEFRGFIVNFIMWAVVVTTAVLSFPHWHWWAWLILGLVLTILLPLPTYHPTQAEKEADKIRRSTIYIPPGE